MANDYDNLKKELLERERQGDHASSLTICRDALKIVPLTDRNNFFYFGIKLAALLLADDNPTAGMVEEGISVLHLLASAMDPKLNPRRWAAIQLHLGIAKSGREVGDDSDNLKSAICHYENALEAYDRHQSPRDWALTKVAAGDAYWRLGDSHSRAKARLYYEDALTIFTPEAFPEENADYFQALEKMRASTGNLLL